MPYHLKLLHILYIKGYVKQGDKRADDLKNDNFVDKVIFVGFVCSVVL